MSEDSPDEEDGENGAPEDAGIQHTKVVGIVDEIEILARALVVCARDGSVCVSPMRLEGFGLAHVLDVASTQLV